MKKQIEIIIKTIKLIPKKCTIKLVQHEPYSGTNLIESGSAYMIIEHNRSQHHTINVIGNSDGTLTGTLNIIINTHIFSNTENPSSYKPKLVNFELNTFDNDRQVIVVYEGSFDLAELVSYDTSKKPFTNIVIESSLGDKNQDNGYKVICDAILVSELNFLTKPTDEI